MSTGVAELSLAPPAFLAPMAGITDLPFRRLARRFGAGLVVSEMVASQEMVQARPGARERAELGLAVENSAVQLAGREARWMAEAARMVEANGARIIDINMGCPARRVTGGMSGSALMKDLDHALRLIEAVVGAVSLPVTLKCRLGWNAQMLNAPDLARRAEAAGVRMITVHGRTRCQFYRGRADWAAIGAVKRAVRIPVIANGDIATEAEARRALAESGADGVMIGRAARGRPWLPGRLGAALTGAPGPAVPCGEELAALAAEHYEEALSFYGAPLGGRVMRKHLGWYMDHAGTPESLRRRVLTEEAPAAVLRLLPPALAGRPVEDPAEEPAEKAA